MARIRNWEKFQHYKHRNPPWIKLYREILDDREWHELSGESAKGLISLWLIAAENDGELPASKTLAFRMRISENRVIALLSDCAHWICDDASTLLASCKQDATPETEKSRDRVETETDKTAPSAPLVPITTWLGFVEMRKKMRKPLTDHATDLIHRKLQKLRDEGEDLVEVVEQSIRNSWQDVFSVRKESGNAKRTNPSELAVKNAKALWPGGRAN